MINSAHQLEEFEDKPFQSRFVSLFYSQDCRLDGPAPPASRINIPVIGRHV
jgi:hypothetical protein